MSAHGKTMLGRYRKSLINLFRRVHELEADRVGKRLLALHIQEELLTRITRAERLIRKTRAQNSTIKQRLAERGNSREFATALKADHQRGLDYIDTQKELISTLKAVGDSVAFIYGEKHELKQLLQNGDAGFISGIRGTRLERAILRSAFKEGATVVMNDLTSTLRRGDITVFQPDLWPDGGSPFLMIEAKSGRGGNRKRAERQKQAANEIIKYIKTDVRESEHGQHIRVAPKEKYSHHFEAATSLIKRLPPRGWINEEVETGLRYVIINCGVDTRKFPDVFASINKPGANFFMLYVNEIKHKNLGYYPFPLCIRDSESLFRFYNGEFVFNIFVDVKYINKRLARRGVRIEIHDDSWQLIRLGRVDGIAAMRF